MKRTEGVYKLYEAVSKGQREQIIDTWFSLLGSSSAGSMLASVITFVGKVNAGPTPKMSKWMHRTVTRAAKMCDTSPSVLHSIMLYSETSSTPLELVGLNVLLAMARVL